MDFFKWLDDESLVSNYTINAFQESNNSLFYNLTIYFRGNSVLFAREYIVLAHRKYSFYWQNVDKLLKIRWDNAPHFKHIATFPHHKHIGENDIQASFDITFEDVIRPIKNSIS